MGRRMSLGRVEALFENLNRELDLGQTSLKFKNSGGVSNCTITGQTLTIETITADKELDQEDSGKIFLLDAAAEGSAVTITLPLISNAPLIGVTYKFVIKDASDGGFKIVTGDLTNSTGDVMIGYIMIGADQISSTSNGAGGRMVVPGAGEQTLTLDGNAGNGGGEAGSVVNITCVDSSTWLVEGLVFTSEATSTGADFFTDTAP